MLVTVPRMSGGHTVFVAVGNLFGYLCIAATLFLACAAALSARAAARRA